ncbi:MAG: hypothetical protein ACN4GM_07175 [Gammaproteobacteria bacterium]
MRNKLLISGLILSITLISLIGFYALNTSHKIITSFKEGDEYFKDIATAATELSSFAKRAEGHLLLYLVLHRNSDKAKFPKRMESLHEKIFILDQKLENLEARTILGHIKANVSDILSTGNTLIADHDKSMEARGGFEIGQYREAILKLHDNFSAIRKFGVELATLEINLEHKIKLNASENAAHLQSYMLLMIILTSVFAIILGYTLIKIINNLNKEISNRVRSEKVLKLERNKLADALAKVKTLSGLLPICAECKNIRDDKGYWSQIENYIRNHSEAEFSHSICPNCLEKLYPEYYKQDES